MLVDTAGTKSADFEDKFLRLSEPPRSWERPQTAISTLYGGEFTLSTRLLTLNHLLYSLSDAAPQFL